MNSTHTNNLIAIKVAGILRPLLGDTNNLYFHENMIDKSFVPRCPLKQATHRKHLKTLDTIYLQKYSIVLLLL